MSQFPDPYGPGGGQEAVQPPPGQPYGQQGQPYGQPSQGQPWRQAQPSQHGDAYGQLPPPQGYDEVPSGQAFTQAPAVAADYGYGQYPNAAPQGMFLDQVSGLNLPQGTQLASVGRRIGAYFLAIPLAVVTLGIGYIIWGLIVWGNGQTPALQVLGMRCWRPETGRVAGFWFMALREIVGRIIDGILSVITAITSFVLFVAGKEHKSLHDHIAGTVVLYDPDKVLAS